MEQLFLALGQTGQTVNAICYAPDGTRWNGSAFAATSSISDASWATGAISITELASSNSTATGNYTAAVPAGIVSIIEADTEAYTFLFFIGTPTPAMQSVGQQSIVVASSGTSAASIADAVWDEARSGHVAAGSFGQYVLARDDSAEALATAALFTVDGITLASAVEALLAVTTGVATVSGSTVTFKKRDGTTTKMTITYGSTDGERTANTLS